MLICIREALFISRSVPTSKDLPAGCNKLAVNFQCYSNELQIWRGVTAFELGPAPAKFKALAQFLLINLDCACRIRATYLQRHLHFHRLHLIHQTMPPINAQLNPLLGILNQISLHSAAFPFRRIPSTWMSQINRGWFTRVFSQGTSIVKLHQMLRPFHKRRPTSQNSN